MSQTVNTPYVKSYDAKGELINPILFQYKGYGPNRKERRLEGGKTSTRPFSNKKGIKLKIVRVSRYAFMKFEAKVIKQGKNDTRVQFVERKKTK